MCKKGKLKKRTIENCHQTHPSYSLAALQPEERKIAMNMKRNTRLCYDKSYNKNKSHCRDHQPCLLD